MAYSQNTYLKAKQELELRRETAEDEAQRRRDDCFAKFPELREIQQKLSRIGFQISKSFLDGGDIQESIRRLSVESLALQTEREFILEQAGLPKEYLKVRYCCEICSDTGFDGDRFCKCHKELLAKIEKDEISRYAPIHKCTFANFDISYYSAEATSSGVSPKEVVSRIYEGCKNYAASFTRQSKSLLLLGGTGLGKTHLSLAVANEVIDKGFSVVYGSAHSILSDLESLRFGRNTNVRYEEPELLECDLLIIDDLGAEFISQFTVSCIYNIVNSRILSERPTIISTNLTVEDLEAKYDRRITSRLTSCYSILRFFGRDVRQIKKRNAVNTGGNIDDH